MRFGQLPGLKPKRFIVRLTLLARKLRHIRPIGLFFPSKMNLINILAWICDVQAQAVGHIQISGNNALSHTTGNRLQSGQDHSIASLRRVSCSVVGKIAVPREQHQVDAVDE